MLVKSRLDEKRIAMVQMMQVDINSHKQTIKTLTQFVSQQAVAMKAAHAASIALLSAPPSYGLPPDVHEAFRATKEGMSKIDFCVPEHHFAITDQPEGQGV